MTSCTVYFHCVAIVEWECHGRLLLWFDFYLFRRVSSRRYFAFMGFLVHLAVKSGGADVKKDMETLLPDHCDDIRGLTFKICGSFAISVQRMIPRLQCLHQSGQELN